MLFLDEPTSGLDAFTALSVVNTLDTLARNNYSVVCTIHQPRYNIFEMFDQLLVCIIQFMCVCVDVRYCCCLPHFFKCVSVCSYLPITFALINTLSWFLNMLDSL